MAEKAEFAGLLRASRGDALVVSATFLLVVFRDLTEGILVGFALGALLFLHRMANAVTVESRAAAIAEADRADSDRGAEPYPERLVEDHDIFVCRISGAFFFGAAASVGTVLDRIAERPKVTILDFSDVPFIDSSAGATIAGFVRKAERRGASVLFAGAGESTRRILALQDHAGGGSRFCATVEEAVRQARSSLGERTHHGEPVPAA